MQPTSRLLIAGLVLGSLVVPALMAPPAMADAFPPLLFPQRADGSSGNGTTPPNGTGNATSPWTVELSGPSVMFSDSDATWTVKVGYHGSGGNNTTAVSHHADLDAYIGAAFGTVTITNASVDVPEGGYAYAVAHVHTSSSALGQATLWVSAVGSDGYATAKASFLVV